MSEEELTKMSENQRARIKELEDKNRTLEAEKDFLYRESKHALWLYAYWKDGIQHVGNMGNTLKEAYKEQDKRLAGIMISDSKEVK